MNTLLILLLFSIIYFVYKEYLKFKAKVSIFMDETEKVLDHTKSNLSLIEELLRDIQKFFN